MNERSCPESVKSQLTTNEKIRKLAEANPDLADVLKSKFPEAFEDEYLKFPDSFFAAFDYPFTTLKECAHEAGVKRGEGIYVLDEYEVITKPLSNGATAVLFKIKK